jgi:hypothetical protein
MAAAEAAGELPMTDVWPGDLPAGLNMADVGDYYGLCIYTVGMAVELYRYEYGRLPTRPEELVELDYLDAWPRDPLHDWQPVPADFGGETAASDGESVIELMRYEGGGYELLNQLGWDFSLPAATWLETEARLHGLDYLAYEQQLSQQYPDRALWPASSVVWPATPAAAPGQPTPR